MKDQDEMFEAATETPAFLGCPSLGPKTLPGDFDGTAPGGAQGGAGVPPAQEEAKAKLEASVARQREVLTQIADLALAAEAKSGNANVKLGSKWLDNSKAICEIRQLCGPDLVEKAQIESGAFCTPGWLCELAKKLQAQEPIREDSPNSPDSRSEIEKMNSALFGILRKTVVIATDAMHDYIEEGITEEEGNARFFAACAEIRQLIDVYKPSEKVKVEERDEPIMPGCPSLMPRQPPGGFDGVGPASHPAQRPLRAASQGDMTGADKRKPTMDFGRFHVTRAAIPGTTILTFRRKREHLPEFMSVVPGRIIVAKITKKDVGGGKPTHRFTVKSYEAGEKPRVLFAGDSWVCMSKTEKMVYKMVKCDVKETQRRRISRKRAARLRTESGHEAAKL